MNVLLSTNKPKQTVCQFYDSDVLCDVDDELITVSRVYSIYLVIDGDGDAVDAVDAPATAADDVDNDDNEMHSADAVSKTHAKPALMKSESILGSSVRLKVLLSSSLVHW